LAILVLTLLAFSPSTAMAQGGEFSDDDYPESLTGPRLFSYTSFHLLVGTVFYNSQNLNDPDLSVITLNPGATIGILPELSIDVDIWMDIITGDQSDFTFSAFGTGLNYIFFNVKPVILTTGIGFRLINQSLSSTFSPDIFFLRPYLGSGIGVWRLYFSPYVGVPIYIDVNNDNDADPYPDRKAETSWMDRDPFGVDYGVPISLLVWDPIYLTVEPSGLTFFYPETDTTLWITPGILMRGGMFRMGLGVQIRLYPEGDSTDRWMIIGSAGVAF